MNLALLERLCAAYGIASGYRDIWGVNRMASVQTRLALLAATGIEVRSDADIESALKADEAREWRRLLPPVIVVRVGDLRPELPVTLPAAAWRERVEWSLELESGARRTGRCEPEHATPAGERCIGGATFIRFRLPLTELPAPGYHQFEITGSAGHAPLRARTTLIVVPPRCYLPPALEQGRAWGPMTSLWAVRSRRNWGMGDYSDLRNLVEFAAGNGAALVGVNPLHALFPHDPDHASPYSPASRVQWNVLYIDPEGMPDFAECAEAREFVRSAPFQARLAALRAAERVDYRAVAAAKFEVFERLHAHFRDRHLAADTARARAFNAFRRERGEALRLASLYFALQEHLVARNPAFRGWRAWPVEYRDPGSAAVARFSRTNAGRVDFYDYLQWIAELQIDAAGRRARELGLDVGLFQDLAVGADRDGAEAWEHQRLCAGDVGIGAPPDEFNLNGQDWGLPPYRPRLLEEAAYAPFIAILRANMRHAGALRIDHVMGLMRLYWIPAGAPPAAGAYVSYPVDDLLGILALESQRNCCMVIGEDLGTLPEGLAERLQAAGVLSYRVLYFERESDGAFRAPRDYPAQALAAVTTHDLPTLRAFWEGRDLDLRWDIGLFPDRELRQRQVAERAQDRSRLLMALDCEKLLPEGVTMDPVPGLEMIPALVRGVHRFLARTPCRLLTLQLEDAFGQVEQPNLPATSGQQHPNWRYRLALELERWGSDPRVRALVAAVNEERAAPAAAALSARRGTTPA